MISLVGYTGFVGSNIYKQGTFNAVYNSQNIADAFGTNPELLIYAGLRAEKYLANNAPEKDMECILQAEENIRKINPRKLVLISTIDVFKSPRDVDENSPINMEGLHAYGYNRYQLELWIKKHYADALIIRLPGLFGKNIKKNFIYDYMNRIPFMLTREKMEELALMNLELKNYYESQENGFFRVKNLSESDRAVLRDTFKALGFSALNFTDSRSKYQFYNLERLWGDIQIALDNDLTMWHPATEPVSAGELYRFLTGEDFVNELAGVPADYNYKTIHAKIFNGTDGYICSKREIMNQIKAFVEEEAK